MMVEILQILLEVVVVAALVKQVKMAQTLEIAVLVVKVEMV
jgi:hypothetical protein